jgi:hypothetical protein
MLEKPNSWKAGTSPKPCETYPSTSPVIPVVGQTVAQPDRDAQVIFVGEVAEVRMEDKPQQRVLFSVPGRAEVEDAAMRSWSSTACCPVRHRLMPAQSGWQPARGCAEEDFVFTGARGLATLHRGGRGRRR